MAQNKLSKAVFAAIAFIVVLAVVALWAIFYFRSPAPTPDQPPISNPNPGTLQGTVVSPQLTEAAAVAALRSRLFADCLPGGVPDSYRSCKVEMFKEVEGQGWKVWITYEGLYDDSVAASRVEAYLTYQDGIWVASNVVETSRCQQGRGHQDFSTEFCT